MGSTPNGTKAMNNKILTILRSLRENLLKYTRTGSFDETAALLCGLDHATRNQGLEGFQEWITIQLKGDYSNTFWAISSLYVTFPESQGNPAFVPPDEDRARNGLLDQVEQFLSDRKTEGLDALRKKYQAVRNEWDEWYENEFLADLEEEQEDD